MLHHQFPSFPLAQKQAFNGLEEELWFSQSVPEHCYWVSCRFKSKINSTVKFFTSSHFICVLSKHIIYISNILEIFGVSDFLHFKSILQKFFLCFGFSSSLTATNVCQLNVKSCDLTISHLDDCRLQLLPRKPQFILFVCLHFMLNRIKWVTGQMTFLFYFVVMWMPANSLICDSSCNTRHHKVGKKK